MFKRTAQTYQHGSLTIEKRKTGPDVWVYRWREAGANGTRTKRKIIVGGTDVFKTQAAAQKAVDGLRLEVNSETVVVKQRNLTMGELISHYAENELTGDRKSPSTQRVYTRFLHAYVEPQWGASLLRDVRPGAVERWLDSLPYAPGTCTKIKNILSALFQHAIRQDWAENNPIRAVRTSSKRLREPDILTMDEINLLLPELPQPCRTMALLATVTGMRVSEIVGLQWGDIDLDSALLHLRRGVVNQDISNLKTVASKRPLPIPEMVTHELTEWKKQTSFNQPEHWVFTNPLSDGKQPYWPNTLSQRHLQPAAERVGITKRIGWHTFRRSFATLLLHQGEDVRTVQELLGHASPVVTLSVYAQAITETKRQAQNHLTATLLPLAPSGPTVGPESGTRAA